MFGSNLVMPSGSLLSYQDAVNKFNSITPIRGRRDDTRPVAQRRNDNFTIRRLHDDSIAIRLYQTDIITYRPDGTIELEPYSSVLTNDAVSFILRRAVTPQYTHPAGPVLWVKRKGYRIPDFAVLSPDMELIAGSAPFIKWSLDKSKGPKVLKTSGYKTFALWLKTQIRLGIDPRQDTDRYGALHFSNLTIGALDNPDYYPDIARGMSVYRDIDDQLAALRLAVHEYHDTVVEEEIAYVSSWCELETVRRSQLVWGS